MSHKTWRLELHMTVVLSNHSGRHDRYQMAECAGGNGPAVLVAGASVALLLPPSGAQRN